jgi:type II secretory pathway component GspD/PulD (secretin)
MPEKEFELYLSLLGKLLRLSPQQKTSIEAELRDHFEERFEALVRSGVPRDQAIQRTLDEFGDVAGLAHDFTHLSRKHIRRRIMQGTAATVGVAAAVVIWATLFRGPEPAVGPAPNVVAQDEPANAANAQEKQPSAATLDWPTVGQLEYIDPGQFVSEKLRKEIDVEFTGTPLRDVISYIAEITQLPILFDIPALNDQGITGDEEVSLVILKTPTHTVLNLLLAEVSGVRLAWMEDAEVVQITTKHKADHTLRTQYHNVRDLLKNGFNHDELTEGILEMTEGPWATIDGTGGSIAEFGDLLVVHQCQRTQIDVACFLAGLRSKAPVRLVGNLPADAKIRAALDESTSIEFTGTPLRDVISYVSEIHHIPILFDVPALSDQSITGDEEVSLVVNGIKLRSALQLLLESVNSVQLDVVVQNGLMIVTTKKKANQILLQTVFYDVSEITANDPVQMDKLEEIIQNQTEGYWESIDGIGGVLRGLSPNLLACRQTRQAQDEVASVLGAIRDSLKAAGGDRSSITQYDTRLETRFYRMDAEAALDVARLIPSLIEPGTWKGVVGNVPTTPEQIELQVGAIDHLNAGRVLMQLESGAIVDQAEKQPSPGSPPPTADPNAPTTDVADPKVVVIPQQVLIITHKPAVLRQISRLLNSLLKSDRWPGAPNGANEKVKFIAPGYQEGTWGGTLGSSAAAPGGGFFSIDSPNDP